MTKKVKINAGKVSTSGTSGGTDATADAVSSYVETILKRDF